MNKPRGRGRPRGRSTTREDILAVAGRRFLAEGYAAVSMRSVAAEAGVDPALISYHFGSKRGLFGAALELTINPTLVVAAAVDAPDEVLPERLLRSLLAVWDEPERSAPLRRLFERVAVEPDAARMLREVVEREILGQFAERLGGHDRRAAAVTVQLAGLIFLRYLLRVEPLASMSADEVVATLGPTIALALGTPSRRRPSPR